MNENKYGRKVAILALALMVGYVLFFKVWDGGHKWTENIRDFRDYGYRVIDTQGQLASDECFYHSVKFNSNGVRLDRRGSKLYGFVDLQGSEVYEKASELIKDKSMAFRSEIEFYLDDDIFIATLEDDDELSVHIILLESGEEYIVENAYAEMVSVNYSEDLFVVQDRNTMKEGYVNKYGQWIIEPGFDSAYKFSDGLARVRENGLYGYIDHQGNYVIPPQFSSADEFSEGYAAVNYEEGKYGYIDKQGNMVIEPQYKYAESFSDGLARVFDYSKDKFGYINPNGDVVIDFQFEDANDFCYGLASVYDSSTNKYGYIDTSGKIVIPYKYENAYSFTADGLAIVECGNDTSTYIDKNGNYLFKPQSIGLDNYNNGYACIYMRQGDAIDYSDSVPTEWKEQYSKKIKMQDFILYICEHSNEIAGIIGAIWLLFFTYYSIKYVREELRIKPEDNDKLETK